MIKYFKLGKRIYDCKRDFLAYRHVAVFTVRSLRDRREMEQMSEFFCANDFRKELADKYPTFFAQLTRKLLYKNSTTAERLNLIKQTFLTIENNFTVSALHRIYYVDGIRLWSEEYQGKTLSIDLVFRNSETREGLLTLALRLDDEYIYHINFWITDDDNNQLAFGIGALQGARDGLSINKELTKHFFGYRPKNLILYALRIFAQRLDVTKIYAVSNYGFYANNHIRLDRKLKTSLDEFWQESGGGLGRDKRFFYLPVEEQRKTIEEVVSHKRNLYRKRFAALDALAAEMNTRLDEFLK